jgi:hypothetical protein
VGCRTQYGKFEQRLYSLLTFGVALLSGGALSFIFIYAVRSAAFAVSWPLFVILIIVMIANEFISTHNYRFTLDIGVLVIALTFYSIFDVPIFFGAVNNFVFLVSICLAALVAFLYISILKRTSETAEVETARGYALSIGIPLFIAMFYFLNVIPAVPLSLKESGIYRVVARTGDGSYFGQKETDVRFLAKWRRPIYHIADNNTGVYYFSAVSAPAEVSAPLTHVWEYYDRDNNKWVTATTVAFEMEGGRGEGYRAYSKKENVFPGMWRVTVKVDDNRIVGRIRFYIVEGEGNELQEVKL